MRKPLLVVVLAAGVAASTTGAQTKPAITRADYGQWESLSPSGLSPDGTWAGYLISRGNRTTELRLIRLSDRFTKAIPSGSALSFAGGSKWAAASIGYTEAEQEKMRASRQPIQNKLALVNLTSGEMTTTDGVASFTFSRDGKYLAMRRYAPAAAPGAPPAAPAGAQGAQGAQTPAPAETEPLGVTVIVRDLASGRDTTFGNVGETAWQASDAGHLLAMTISADGQTGNGVHLFDPETTVLRVLESASAGYNGLTWRQDSTDLVVLRSKTDPGRDGFNHLILAWRGLGTPAEQAVRFDPASAQGGLAADKRVVSFRRPSWSDDGKMVFAGIAEWAAKRPPAGRGRGAGPAPAPESGEKPATPPAPPPASKPPAVEPDEPAGVDIWHWMDVDVMARQKLSAAGDRRRNLLAVWHLDGNRLLPIGQSWTESVQPVRRTSIAYVEEWKAYGMERSIGRPAADLYVADLLTGTRTKLETGVQDGYAQISPTGKFVLFLRDDQYWLLDVNTKATKNLTKAIATSFIDRESDQTVKQKPPFGVAGWVRGDRAVLLNDKLDIWEVPTDGSRATRLTNGAAEQVRHRLVRLNPDDEWVDLDKPLVMSLFGIWSKKSGYGILPAEGESVTRAIWLDQSVGSLAKAQKADVYTYIAQTHADSPDLFVTGATLTGVVQVTKTNEFQSKFAWSKGQLVEYKTDKGLRLQGALYYPAGYEPGKRYPMIVYMYERLSDSVHRYVAPSDRDYYNTTVFTSQGYFVLQPDIVFRPREPGLSVVECVTAAVKQVATMNLIDPAKVGVVGHSWGGFDAAYLATRTNGVFAASVAGAAITNLVSNYGNHHWSSGIAETDHIETGQQRMEVPLYEDFPAYVRNSAVFNVQNMTTPLMLMTGDSDGTVFWHQAVELYNIARRAKKNVVMLVYTGEDHSLRQKKNQVDYQQRILAWFGHYLKGEPAPTWIATGVTFLEGSGK
jgi:dipeptidyl aminopeptidase/acylaminoacyl peptidase